MSYKTTVERRPELQSSVHQKHGYEVPEWITLPVTGGSDAHLSWVVGIVDVRHRRPLHTQEGGSR
ncbi:divalent cation tolerance protein CutA [Streptomyces sp. NPDC101160]|uniref:divalent cation tolerance protein CutA n=1 Tax=Streptomyces sp. NPDC101160 TaxID=3366118 RepID=UPI003808165C